MTSFTYSFRKGDSGRIAVTNDQGLTETTPYRQSIRTMGWKTDFMLNPVKEFSLNLTFTLQNPKLAMYKFEAFG